MQLKSFPLSRVRFFILGACILFSVIELIISAVVTAGRVKVGDGAVKKVVHSSAAVELIVPSLLAVLWFPIHLLLSTLFPYVLPHIFDSLLFSIVLEFIIWALFLGGAASLASPSNADILRTLCGLGFIVFMLLTVSLSILLSSFSRYRTPLASIHTVRLSDVLPHPERTSDEEMGQRSLRPSIGYPKRSVGSLRSNHSNNSHDTNRSNLTHASANGSQTYIPPSSSAWPSAAPAPMNADTEPQTFRKQDANVRAFLDNPRGSLDKHSKPLPPSPFAPTYNPRRPLPDPDEDMGERAQWAKMNANKGFEEEMTLRNGGFIRAAAFNAGGKTPMTALTTANTSLDSVGSIREASWVSVGQGPRGVAIARDMGRGRGIQYPSRAARR
ncbi:hypothetical protein BT69DRAFT_1350180 [Atractiella rhizophila]|nr:hypothetical protein BT69DRAFT_1350180 [Atractiella rhizophila]